MLACISVHVSESDVPSSYDLDGGGVCLIVRPVKESTAEVRVYCPSLDWAEKLADQIWHLRMDRDASGMQAEEAKGAAAAQIVPAKNAQ